MRAGSACGARFFRAPIIAALLASSMLLMAATTVGAKTYFGCDGRWLVDDYGNPYWDYSSTRWRSRPASCFLDTDATTAGQFNLEGLTWSGWGKKRAIGTGVKVANHYADDGTLPRYATTIRLSGRVRACRTKHPNRWYYTHARISTPELSISTTIPLVNWGLPRSQCRYHDGPGQ